MGSCWEEMRGIADLKDMVEAGRIELPSKTVGPSIKPRASPLYFISSPPSAEAAWADNQFDFFSLNRYEQKLIRRSGFC